MRTVFLNANIINEGEHYVGSLVVEGDVIKEVVRDADYSPSPEDEVFDAKGMTLIPGVIDDHVHMRDPGLTHKGDMVTETCAASAGGVTTVFDMPNVSPQTTSLPLLEERYALAQGRCQVNYAFFLGATLNNIEDIAQADVTRIPGIKLFMGSSTGNMLVDDEAALDKVFSESRTLIMTHCEDTNRINANMQKAMEACGCDDPDVSQHPHIRDAQACLMSTQLAVNLALKHDAQLHVAHLSTEAEVELLRQTSNPKVTGEACVAHLIYTEADYKRLGTRIKCNPAIKSESDRDALRKAILDGTITVIGTDHAPHLLSEKEGGSKKAVSGMPMIQFSLQSMLQLSDEGLLSPEAVVMLMCHNPAELFKVEKRGFLRPGYKADFVLLTHDTPHTLEKSEILSRCGWSPREGDTFNWQISQTWVNGKRVWNGKEIECMGAGEPVRFLR
ncbi:MAG: dihydroorotase [Bacteroidaceae bacterium]|nr:dihydroorotase [Bacteroidaceae bacterium]